MELLELFARFFGLIVGLSVVGTCLNPLFAAGAIENYGKWQFNYWLVAIVLGIKLMHFSAEPFLNYMF